MPDHHAGATARPPVRVAVVGTGNVGATYAYALLFSGLAAEIVLINRSREDAEGEAMDLTHAVPFAQPARVWAGDYPDCTGAAVVVLTVGAPQGDAPDRLALVEKNGAVFAEIVPEVVRHNPGAILLVASNPVDVLTYASWKLSGLPRERVIGSGTILDTARLRALLGERLGVDPRDVHAEVVGEHGESQVAVWSQAHVGGAPLVAVAEGRGKPLDGGARDDLARETRSAGPAVADRKGATYYGVAGGLLRITAAILRDERSVLTVSTVVDGYGAEIDGVALSLPSVVGRDGARPMLPLGLSPEETTALRASAAVLRETQGKLPLG